MPTLQFKGKTAIWNHHLSIPCHTLDAPACFLDKEFLQDSGIEFVSIPYGLYSKSGGRS